MSGILPIFSRTPTLLAMTAAGLDSVSRDRFELGMGFHGAPLGRIRENEEIRRAIWRRERLGFRGALYTIPLPTDPGSGGLPEERRALRWWHGGAGANFYNDLAVGYGCAEEAAAIQDLHLTGRTEEAAAAVPN